MPERDRARAGIGPSATAVVGHENKQPIARQDLFPLLVEPLAQTIQSGGVQPDRPPCRVNQLRARFQAVAKAGALEEPEVLWRRVSGCEVSRRIFTVGREDMDSLGRDPSSAQHLHHVLEVLQMTQVVRRGLTAAVDEQRVNGTTTRPRAFLRANRGSDAHQHREDERPRGSSS